MAIKSIMAGWLKSGTSADDIRKALVEALGEVSGQGVVIWTHRDGQLEPQPNNGAVLRERWANDDQDVDTWYPTEEKAQAALAALALFHGRTPSTPRYVDLTRSGCSESYASIKVIE